VLTTHLNLIKGYAHLQEEVENAAVEFDPQTLAPTYRLHYGIPGASSAFTIARRLGLPEEVLEKAEEYLGAGDREGLDLIERLNALTRELEDERAEARRLTERARAERDKRRRLLEELEEQKRTILDKATRRSEERVRKAESRLRDLLKEAEAAGAAPPQRARLAGKLNEVREEVARQRPQPRRGRTPQEVAAGEIVRVVPLGVDAEVLRSEGGTVELSAGGKKLRLGLEALEQFSPRRFAAGARPARVKSSVERTGFEPRLLLVGQRVDAALGRLETFIDDALLHDQRQVEVVHGSGEGILRRAVREFLAGHREVSAFHAAAPEQGGENVTIVELRSG
jgi:DNA mismatch repair protein MutS2